MPNVRLRRCPVKPKDRAFLYEVFCSTRPDVSCANLPEAEKEYFLRMQFQAQDTHYHNVFPNAEYSVVSLGNPKIGRLYVDRRPDEIRILDITILPEFRGRGYGSTLFNNLFAEASVSKRPIRIHVELGSRQIKFYHRLGFVKTGEIPTHQLMEWTQDSIIILA